MNLENPNFENTYFDEPRNDRSYNPIKATSQGDNTMQYQNRPPQFPRTSGCANCAATTQFPTSENQVVTPPVQPPVQTPVQPPVQPAVPNNVNCPNCDPCNNPYREDWYCPPPISRASDPAPLPPEAPIPPNSDYYYVEDGYGEIAAAYTVPTVVPYPVAAPVFVTATAPVAVENATAPVPVTTPETMAVPADDFKVDYIFERPEVQPEQTVYEVPAPAYEAPREEIHYEQNAPAPAYTTPHGETRYDDTPGAKVIRQEVPESINFDEPPTIFNDVWVSDKY